MALQGELRQLTATQLTLSLNPPESEKIEEPRRWTGRKYPSKASWSKAPFDPQAARERAADVLYEMRVPKGDEQ